MKKEVKPSAKRWKRIRKNIARGGIGNKYIIDTVPKKWREYAKQLQEKRKRDRLSMCDIHLDKKIYLHKWYPWCYKNFKPTLCLQGWYNIEAAKYSYKAFYGPDSLKYIKFIKGRAALEREFAIGRTLFINGRWQTIQVKMIVPYGMNIGYSHPRRSFRLMITKHINKNLSSKKIEKVALTEHFYRTHGRGNITIHKPKERLELQKIQETYSIGKSDLYEEE